jgi:hypothetical protein
MPFTSKLTAEERDLLFTLAREGQTYSEIANRLGNKITRQRVKQLCAKAKINTLEIRQAKNQEQLTIKLDAKWGKEWHSKESRKSYIYQAMKEKFRVKKANSVRLGNTFTIEFGDLVFPTHCPVLGIELDYFTENGWQDNSPSFDCIDPNKDYVKGNVAIISMRANRIKNNGTAEEHRKIADFMDQFIE